MCWWSLTDKKQLVKRYVTNSVQANPQSLETNKVSRIESKSMALAIAWKRATSA
jgi:hypothetical protein